ncbi:hypothetical protein HDU96_001394 [Phlyctochytrium bullatum]|nr:hypothetical protein HDU96_001394 [Phlyctochytrium bullatum]
MVAITALLVTALVAGASAAPALAPRSFYPPDQIISKSCQTNGPVTVCAINQGLGTPSLSVTYASSGYLWSQASPLSAWVKINQASETVGPFTAAADTASASYTVGGITDVRFCYRGTKAEEAGYVPPAAGVDRCPVNEAFPLLDGGVGQGSFGWFYNPASAKEVAMVKQSGTWNVEVAVKNDKNSWDSKFGANYKFTF